MSLYQIYKLVDPNDLNSARTFVQMVVVDSDLDLIGPFGTGEGQDESGVLHHWNPPKGCIAVKHPEGENQPEPVQTTTVPQTVSAMQAKVALSRAGVLAAAEAWVAGQGSEAQLIWNTATIFSRNSELIENAAAALGLSSEQVDALFVAAAKINP